MAMGSYRVNGWLIVALAFDSLMHEEGLLLVRPQRLSAIEPRLLQ